MKSRSFYLLEIESLARAAFCLPVISISKANLKSSSIVKILVKESLNFLISITTSAKTLYFALQKKVAYFFILQFAKTISYNFHKAVLVPVLHYYRIFICYYIRSHTEVSCAAYSLRGPKGQLHLSIRGHPLQVSTYHRGT